MAGCDWLVLLLENFFRLQLKVDVGVLWYLCRLLPAAVDGSLLEYWNFNLDQ